MHAIKLRSVIENSKEKLIMGKINPCLELSPRAVQDEILYKAGSSSSSSVSLVVRSEKHQLVQYSHTSAQGTHLANIWCECGCWRLGSSGSASTVASRCP